MRGIPPDIRALVLLLAVLVLSSCSAGKAAHPSSALHLRVESSRIAANADIVEIRFRILEGGKYDPDSTGACLVEESTGERFYIIRLQRIGPVTEDRWADGRETHTLLFRNREGKLKAGSRVTLQIGTFTQKHVLLEK